MVTVVGVFGSHTKDYQDTVVQQHIHDIFSNLYKQHGSYVWVVSDCLDSGISKIAFDEAQKYNWYTIGVHSSQLPRYPIYVTDHFLVVDDDKDMINVLTKLLSILIYDVTDERAKSLAQEFMNHHIITIGLEGRLYDPDGIIEQIRSVG